MIRRILTDHARARGSLKRGGKALHHTLHEDRVATAVDVDIVDLDDALSKLADFDQRKSDILELHYYGGMTYDEIATALDVSPATVDRELRFAKAWLAHELRDD